MRRAFGQGMRGLLFVLLGALGVVSASVSIGASGTSMALEWLLVISALLVVGGAVVWGIDQRSGDPEDEKRRPLAVIGFALEVAAASAWLITFSFVGLAFGVSDGDEVKGVALAAGHFIAGVLVIGWSVSRWSKRSVVGYYIPMLIPVLTLGTILMFGQQS